MATVNERHVETRDRSITDLIRELRDESMLLVRQEVALAKTEISEKVSRVTRNSITLVSGGVMLYTGLILVLFGIGLVVSIGLAAAGVDETWALPLGVGLVGLLVAVIGAVMMGGAKKALSEESVMPEKTVQSLKEDKEWTKEKLR